MKIIKWFKRFLEWVKGIFKSTKFDNQLFAMGVNKVREVVLEKYEGVTTLDLETLKEKIQKELEEKFKNIKPVMKGILDQVMTYAASNAMNIRVFTTANTKRYINKLYSNIWWWNNSEGSISRGGLIWVRSH